MIFRILYQHCQRDCSKDRQRCAPKTYFFIKNKFLACFLEYWTPKRVGANSMSSCAINWHNRTHYVRANNKWWNECKGPFWIDKKKITRTQRKLLEFCVTLLSTLHEQMYVRTIFKSIHIKRSQITNTIDYKLWTVNVIPWMRMYASVFWISCCRLFLSRNNNALFCPPIACVCVCVWVKFMICVQRNWRLWLHQHSGFSTYMLAFADQLWTYSSFSMRSPWWW